MANYYEQCNCGAYCDEAPCELCRAEQMPCEPKAPAEPAIRLGHNKFPPMQCRSCKGTGAARPRSEILAARRTIGGCCNRHADNMACDCLTEHCCGACSGTGRATP